jgi:hypothetical protein
VNQGLVESVPSSRNIIRQDGFPHQAIALKTPARRF